MSPPGLKSASEKRQQKGMSFLASQLQKQRLHSYTHNLVHTPMFCIDADLFEINLACL